MSPPSVSLQLLLSLALTVLGATAFPMESNSRNLTEDNATGIWDRKPDSLTTVASISKHSGPSDPKIPEITQSHKTTPHRILSITKDYYYYYDDDDDDYDDERKDKTVAPPGVALLPCPYNRCQHMELPCEEIQKRAGGNCLCPGLRGRSFKPDSPRLRNVIPGDTGIGVNWCSPLSEVLGYRVLYRASIGPLERGPILNSTYRFYSIENLLPGTTYRVCVVAYNEAGESPVEEREEEEKMWENGSPGPCALVLTSGTQESKIYMGIGVGLAALAGVLCIVGCSCWLWKKKTASNRKAPDSGERGISNM